MRLCVAHLLLLTSACIAFAQSSKPNAPASDSASRQRALDALIAEEWDWELRTHPEHATYVGDNRFNDRLNDYSKEAIAADLAERKKFLARLDAIDATGLPEQSQLNKKLLAYSLRRSIDSAQFKPWEMPIDQFGGFHLGYASMPSNVPLKTAKDYDNYIARLKQFPRVFDEHIALMRDGLRDGLMQPRYLLEKALVQVEQIANADAASSSFAQPLKKFPADLSDAEKKRLSAAILDAINTSVKPAYASLAKFMREEYVPKGRTEPGIWQLPDGDARYRFAVREMTTTSMTPEQIHQLGLKQVAEIEAEMQQVATRLGFKDVAALNQHIREDRSLYAKSGQQLLGLYAKYKDQAYAKLPELFAHVPKTPLEVVPMESFRAKDSVPADYGPASADSGRPGRINVNEYDPEHRLLLNVEPIAYHEGVPGHHMQFALAQEVKGLPAFRRYSGYNAFVEGWALYAERLAKEVGFYQDPYNDYGRLENEMWRAIRLVVDTGVHYKHWSRQQMVDYFRKYTAMDEPNIQTEVDRYIAWPGQALAYKLGMMKIVELRERARQQLGPKFDLRTFHDEVLNGGAMPLDILEERVNGWIAAQK